MKVIITITNESDNHELVDYMNNKLKIFASKISYDIYKNLYKTYGLVHIRINKNYGYMKEFYNNIKGINFYKENYSDYEFLTFDEFKSKYINETRNITIDIKTAKKWYNSDNESLKQIALQAFKEEELRYITYSDILTNIINKPDFFSSQIGILNSEKQFEKLIAITKLMNVAKYFNKDWNPDWNNSNELKYYIYLDYIYNEIVISGNTIICINSVYFKNKEDAEKAIKILGEDTIRLALSTDW